MMWNQSWDHREMQNPWSRSLAALFGAAIAAFGVAGSAAAVDGVTEINQTLVIANGGFPYVIDAFGSYRLTSDLIVPDANTTAIQVTSPNVTLDLNGFLISGVTTCTGAPVTSCAPTGTGNGIDGSSVSGVRVRNGTVRGVGDSGIDLGFEAVVEDVRAVSNGRDGIEVRNSSHVTRSFATRNGVVGIQIGEGSIVRDSVANGNAVGGFRSNSSSVLRRNVAAGNGGRGMDVFAFGVGSVFVENEASSNGGYGINTFDAAVVARNAVNNNIGGIACADGCAVTGNAASRNSAGPFAFAGTGVDVGAGCSILSNSLRDNSDYGIASRVAGDANGVARNVLTGNGLGAIDVATGADVLNTGPNICGLVLCP